VVYPTGRLNWQARSRSLSPSDGRQVVHEMYRL
jgi:hypothetical protein